MKKQLKKRVLKDLCICCLLACYFTVSINKLSIIYTFCSQVKKKTFDTLRPPEVYSRIKCQSCVSSNSRYDVPRVAQRYGTIAAHIRRRASVRVVFVVCCVHMHSFAGLIRRTPPPTFSDTAIIDRHSDTTIFQLRAHWVRISRSIGSEKSFGHVPPVGSRTLDFMRARRALYPLDQALR